MSQVMDKPWQEQHLLSVLMRIHDVVALAALTWAIAQFARLPNVERAILLYFIPPALAFLYLACDTGRFNRTILRGCRMFLSMIAIAVVLSEQSFLLPNLKQQFPGLPREADRMLTFYFGAYGLFLWVICPAYVFGSSFRHHAQGLPGGMSHVILYTGSACWLLTMCVLVVVLATTDKLF